MIRRRYNTRAAQDGTSTQIGRLEVVGSRDVLNGAIWLRLALVWLAGVSLRITLLAIPPVIPLIHRDLPLSETGIATLTGLPVLLFAVGAVPGSLMIARLGAHRALVIGLFLTAAASGLRGAGPSVAVLFGMTFLMGAGIAVSQPAIPSLIDTWLPGRIGAATAVYVNGILVGEMLSASFTLPVVLPLAGGRWPLSLAFWVVPVVLTGFLLAGMVRRLPDTSGDPGVRWWPDWHRVKTWQLGMLMGGASVGYFTANAFIPDFLRTAGQGDLVGPCLAALNAGQLPASLAIAPFAARIIGRRLPLALALTGTLASLGLFLAGGPLWAFVLAAGMLGFFGAAVFILALALPPILAERGDVHRLSAGMFAVTYAYSFLGPLLGGAAWDLSHVPATAFFPVVLGVVTAMMGIRAIPRGR